MLKKISTLFYKNNQNKTNLNFPIVEDEELVTLIVKDDQNRYALLYSIKHDLYRFPAGKVEPNETTIEAIIRKAKEELGICIVSNQLNPLGFEYDTYTLNGVTKVVKVNAFELIYFSKPIVNAEPHKHRKLAWMNRRQMMMTFAIQRPFSVNSVSLNVESQSLKSNPILSLIAPMSA